MKDRKARRAKPLDHGPAIEANEEVGVGGVSRNTGTAAVALVYNGCGSHLPFNNFEGISHCE